MKVRRADTGPLVALPAANETTHPWAAEQAKSAPATVLTCDAVISEALFILKRARHDTGVFFALIESGFLRSEFDLHAEYRVVRDLMHRYREMPMSFADACLLRMSEIHREGVIWTLDREFPAWRRHRRETVPLVTPW